MVATQLNAELTKQLVITDPYRIKAPAERIETNFHLPLGVQLLRVYVQRRQSVGIPETSSTSNGIVGKNSMGLNFNDTSSTRKSYKKIISSSGMKRDTSRIFTVPEEGESGEMTVLESSKTKEPRPENSSISKTPAPPTSLPINSSITVTRKSEYKSKYVNPPLTPSVCSTPLKDVNRVLHGTAVSICATNDQDPAHDENCLRIGVVPKKIDKTEVALDEIPDVVKEALRCKRLNKLINSSSKLERDTVDRGFGFRKSLSLSDLEVTRQLRISPLGLLENNYNCKSPEFVEKSTKAMQSNIFHTITDPLYPVFRHDGLPVSQSLYDHFIASHYQDLVREQSVTISVPRLRNGNEIWKNLKENKLPLGSIDGFELIEERDPNFDPLQVTAKASNSALDVRLDNNDKSRQEYRRSMSLPLKSLNAPAECETMSDHGDDRRKSNSECTFDISQLKKKKLEGLALTPLMSKLSLLAGDERNSGFNTPSELCDLSTLSSRITRNKSESRTGIEDDLFCLSSVESGTKDPANSGFEKTELFICGHNSMVLFLLMEDGTGNNPDLIHNIVSLFLSEVKIAFALNLILLIRLFEKFNRS